MLRSVSYSKRASLFLGKEFAVGDLVTVIADNSLSGSRCSVAAPNMSVAARE